MVSIAASTEHYRQAFTQQQAKILVEGAVAIEHDLVIREDLSKLSATVERLADRMGGLEEKHDSLEKKMDTSCTDVRKQLGGLSLSVGMGFEAYALDRIPRLLQMHCGLKTETVFPEAFTDGGRLTGTARRDPADQPPGEVSHLGAGSPRERKKWQLPW